MKTTIYAILAMVLAACGSNDRDQTSSKLLFAVDSETFASAVQPILREKCSPCHSSWVFPLLPQFVENETEFLRLQDRILDVTTTSNPLRVMPPLLSGLGRLNEEQLNTIKTYFDGN